MEDQRSTFNVQRSTYILGIESSCDDTSAAVLKNGVLLSNVTASQAVHESYGGVVPELASRAHQQNVVPVVHEAIKRAGIQKEQLSAVAFTRGPGLMGSLLVGVNFAKGFARSLGIPLIDVNHLQGHVMAHFIKEEVRGEDGEVREVSNIPPLPFLCLLVSGGNSQIVKVNAYNDMEVLGQTIDDAAGEAIDKCSKVMGLGYPGGPIIDRLARQGNPKAYQFSEPHIPGLDYSFSGLKTSFLYSLQKWVAEDPDFVEKHIPLTLELSADYISLDEVCGSKDRWMIKPMDAYASKGIYAAGKDYSQEEWEKIIADLYGKGYICQEYCRQYMTDNIDFAWGDGEWHPYINMPGLYVYNGKFVGILMRMCCEENIIVAHENERTVPVFVVKGKK